MKAKSTCVSSARARSVWMAGAITRSIRSETPAASQWRLAMAVHSSETSQQSRRPPSGRALAMASEEVPVKVPTSTASRGRTAETSMERNAPWSLATCMRATPPSSRVAADSDASTASPAVVLSST